MLKLQMRTMDLFLLLALILIGAPRAADGQESVTVKVREGHEAILPCSVSTNMESESFDWKNKDKEVFFYERGAPSGNDRDGQHKDFKHRVFHFQDELKNGNASIRITNTKMADSGAYSCYLPNRDKWCHVELVVDCVLKDRTAEEIPGVCPTPLFTSPITTSTWALLQCEVHGVSPDLQVELKDSSGTVLHAKRTLEPKGGGTYDVVLQTNVTKSGVYSCVVTQEHICHQISSSTSVYVHGVCSKPHFSPKSSTTTWALLQCEVHGVSSDLQVELKDSSGTVLHAKRTLEPKGGGTYDMVLQTNVTKSGVYSCVVTQEDICHQISSNTSVYVQDSTPSNVVIGVLVGVICLLVAVLVVGVWERCRRGPSKDSSYHAADESASMSPPVTQR